MGACASGPLYLASSLGARAYGSGDLQCFYPMNNISKEAWCISQSATSYLEDKTCLGFFFLYPTLFVLLLIHMDSVRLSWFKSIVS